MSVLGGRIELPRMKFGSRDKEGNVSSSSVLSLHPKFDEKSKCLARDLLSALMNPDPKKRVSAKQASNSKWFKVSRVELRELYKKLVGLEPII